MHVSDASRLLVDVCNFSSDKPLIVNGGSGVGTSIKDLLLAIGFQWSPLSIPVFSGDIRAGDPSHFVADTTELQKYGFIQHKNLKIEIPNYVNWFKSLT